MSRNLKRTVIEGPVLEYKGHFLLLSTIVEVARESQSVRKWQMLTTQLLTSSVCLCMHCVDMFQQALASTRFFGLLFAFHCGKRLCPTELRVTTSQGKCSESQLVTSNHACGEQPLSNAEGLSRRNLSALQSCPHKGVIC